METTTYRGKPGAYLLVEKYHGAGDKEFHVPTVERGLEMATGMYASLACVDAAEFATYELYDDQGKKLSPDSPASWVLS